MLIVPVKEQNNSLELQGNWGQKEKVQGPGLFHVLLCLRWRWSHSGTKGQNGDDFAPSGEDHLAAHQLSCLAPDVESPFMITQKVNKEDPCKSSKSASPRFAGGAIKASEVNAAQVENSRST